LHVQRLGAPPEAVLARSEPAVDEDPSQRRARVAESAGARPSPRAEPLVSIDVAVELRVQTALFFDLPEQARAELTGAAPPSRSRREAEQSERCIVALGIEELAPSSSGDDDE
jgi:hypothetical protein